MKLRPPKVRTVFLMGMAWVLIAGLFETIPWTSIGLFIMVWAAFIQGGGNP